MTSYWTSRFALLLTAFVGGLYAAPGPRVLTTALDVRRLSSEEAAKSIPVVLNAVVTYVDLGWSQLYIQDHTAGIFVFLGKSKTDAPLEPGLRIVVRGVSTAGQFAPSVTRATIHVVGPGKMPEPGHPTAQELAGGRLTSRFMELSGVVREASVLRDHLRLDVLGSAGRFVVTIQKIPADWKWIFVDAHVSFRGVMSARFSPQRQFVGLNLFTLGMEWVRFIKPAPGDPFSIPVTGVSDFGRYDVNGVSQHRVHVRAAVSAVETANSVYLSDGIGNLHVKTNQACAVTAGDLVDVIGFPTPGARPSIENAICRSAGKAQPLKSIPLSARSILNKVGGSDPVLDNRYDLAVAQVEGELLDVPNAVERKLVLKSENYVFTALLPPSAAGFVIPAVGARLRLTGVAVLNYNNLFQPDTFRLLLRRPADIAVLSRAPLWNLRTALFVCGAIVMLGGAILAWALLLRRQVASYTEDIRKRLESEAATESRYRRLFERNVAAVSRTTLDGILIECNASMARLLGAGSPAELVGCSTFTSKAIPAQSAALLERLQETGGVTGLELAIDRQDGETVWVSGNLSLAESGDGAPVVEAILIDITRQREYESDLLAAKDAAEAANRAKGEFLANMSHEIRTPLNGIIGMTELALEGSLPEGQREQLELVRTSADSLLNILNDILDFSKIEAGKLSLETVEFNLAACVGEALRAMAPRAAAKELEIVYDVAPDVPANVVGDPVRLRQIVLNLVANAIKFTQAGEVALRVTSQASEAGETSLRFEVADTGIGIPADKLEAIFEPFSQADASTTRRYGGTGLGLTICSRLVSLMGGRMTVDSVPGQGSRFGFDARFTVAEVQTAAAPGLPAGLRVLVAVPHAENGRILTSMIESAGCSVAAALTPNAAAALIRSATLEFRPFSVVLLDAGLLNSEPLELSAALSTVPGVLLLRSVLQLDARCPNVKASISKPVYAEDLWRAMARVLAPVPQAVPAAIRSPQTAAERPLRVLLAEDNFVNQRVATQMLERRGHKVVAAAHGAEALRALERDTFDMVLMDVHMPEMDGFEATRIIRQQERTTGRHIPIIAMTAYAMKGDEERCLEAGMDAYVPKPVDSRRLHETISRVQSLANLATAVS